MIVSERTGEIEKLRQEVLASLRQGPKSFSEMVRMSKHPKATRCMLWVMIVEKLIVIGDDNIVHVRKD